MLKHWTQEKLQILSDNYQFLNNEQLSELLPERSPMSIKHKLGRMGLTRGKWALPESNTNQFPELSELQKAYFAGYFDREGCISLVSSGNVYKIHIAISACHKPVLEKYLEYFGGSLFLGNGVNKPLWKWSLTGYYRALRFIDAILPFSMEKREQLEVARNYIAKRIEASITQPSEDIRELARLSAHRLGELKKT